MNTRMNTASSGGIKFLNVTRHILTLRPFGGVLQVALQAPRSKSVNGRSSLVQFAVRHLLSSSVWLYQIFVSGFNSCDTGGLRLQKKILGLGAVQINQPTCAPSPSPHSSPPPPPSPR